MVNDDRGLSICQYSTLNYHEICCPSLSNGHNIGAYCSETSYKSLRSRGIRFPGRDDESLAPIFTPPHSVPAAEPYSEVAQEGYQEIPDESFAPARTAPAVQVNEAFEVARNSVELLSTVLSSSPQKEVLQDELATTLVQQCQQCQYTIQRIIETAGDNEAQLFEALSIHEELQKVLSKYEKLKEPVCIELEPEPAMIPVTVEPEESPSNVSKEDAHVRKPGGSGDQSGRDDLHYSSQQFTRCLHLC